jgi:hypothetical protein
MSHNKLHNLEGLHLSVRTTYSIRSLGTAGPMEEPPNPATWNSLCLTSRAGVTQLIRAGASPQGWLARGGHGSRFQAVVTEDPDCPDPGDAYTSPRWAVDVVTVDLT